MRTIEEKMPSLIKKYLTEDELNVTKGIKEDEQELSEKEIIDMQTEIAQEKALKAWEEEIEPDINYERKIRPGCTMSIEFDKQIERSLDFL